MATEQVKKKSKLHHLKKKLKETTSKIASKLQLRRKAPVVLEFPLIDRKMKHKLLALLSYLHILVVFPLFFGKKSTLVQYHARQGMTLLVVWVLALFLFWVPILGWLVLFFALIEMIIGIVNVLRGKGRSLPLVGNFTAR